MHKQSCTIKQKCDSLTLDTANDHIKHAKNNKLILFSSPLNACYPYKLNNNNNRNDASKSLPSVVNDKRHCRLFIQAAYVYFTLHCLKL